MEERTNVRAGSDVPVHLPPDWRALFDGYGADGFDLDLLDPGIRGVVGYLRANGFDTTDSGDGETKAAAGDREALSVAHVYMRVADPQRLAYEAMRLRHVLAMAGVALKAIGLNTVCCQAAFDPADGSATLSLYGLNDIELCVSAARILATKCARCGKGPITHRVWHGVEMGGVYCTACWPAISQLMEVTRG